MSLLALLYKAWRISIRHYFKTFILIALPLIFPIIILCQESQSKNNPHAQNWNQDAIVYNKTFKQEIIDDATNQYLNVVYCPNNNLTNGLMNSVKKKLKTATFEGYKAEDDIAKWFMNNSGSSTSYQNPKYGIVFNVKESDVKLPLHVRYKVRSTLSSSLPTNILFPVFQIPGPIEAGAAYLHEGFLGLVVAIDDAILSKAGVKESNWTLQEFPYPAYKRNEENKLNSLALYLPSIIASLFLYVFTSVVSLASNEKSSGIAERMRMFGMNDFMLLLGYVIHVLVSCGISTLIMTILMKVQAGAGPVFEHSNPVVIWVVMLLFCIHSTCYFLAVSSIFSNSTIAIFVSSLFFFIPCSALLMNNDLSSFPIIGQVLTSLLPITYLFWSYQNIFGFENVGQGSDFSNIYKIPVSGYCGIPLIIVLLISIIGCVMFSLIYIYVINVKPGPYGYAKPWNFIFPQKLCAFFKVTPSNLLENESEVDVTTKGLYERVPDNVEVGLKIVNLHKKFGPVIPIKDLSLDVYVGQITALLGHNGAGKTTTLSIISGIFAPTSGSIFYQGYNIFTNLREFRYELGLCPQENMLINDISVWEHLIFFGMLKGVPLKELLLSAKSALNDVHLLEKKDTIIINLSGGMKRKLCLALALVGSPKVIILDEPTSGLDPESRREIWNILLKLRENRIMIITTHFMEEADALGDQIAIMAHGEIKCYGTPMFLKKHYGAGYEITVCSSKTHMFNGIVEFVLSKVPSATVLSKREDSIVFNISSFSTESFPDLFNGLESKEEFEISRIGINCTSMEDVFLKVGEEADNSSNDFKLNGKGLQKTVHLSDVKGRSPFHSFFQRMYALLLKNIMYVKEKWLSYLLMVIVFPVIIAYWTISGTTSLVGSDINNPILAFNLEIYGSTEVILAGNKTPEFRNHFKNLIRGQGSYDVDDTQELGLSNIIEGLLFSARKDILKFRQSMIVAGDFNDTLPNVLYSSVAIHSPVIAVNLLYNSILKVDQLGRNYSISTEHHPFTFTSNFCSDNTFYLNAMVMVFSWLVLVVCLGGVIGHCFIKNPHIERTTLVKHLQLMTNLSPLTYWISFFLWDLMVYCFCTVLILIVLTSLDTVGILSPSYGTGVMFLIMFLFGVSGIWMAYCFTYIFKIATNAFNLFYTGFIVLVVATLITFNIITEESSYMFIVYILRLIPVSPFVSAVQKFITTAAVKLQCRVCQNAYLLPQCNGTLEKSYFDAELNKELYFLGLDWIIYVMIILLIELDYFSKLWNLISYFWIGLVDKTDLNSVESDVAKEKDRVDAALQSSDNDGALTVIVDSLAKKYSPTFTAVHDVTFATKEGECFGLLGVNGAGKSTTFNILTGVQVATQGNVIVKGYSLKENKRKCLSYIGYCPQSSALINSLTGRQMLTLFANLRLTHPSDVEALVNQWISLLGLEEYCDRPCGTYSGGNQRKLSAALAFINNPAIILLDEPTSGVDPVTRRKLWIVIKESQDKKQTVIISSHSMDECEAVCDRLTIMAQGNMQCIGNVQHLKSLYGQGFVILIKLKTHSDEDITKLKEEMLNVFGPNITLKDEHMVMLHYHISDPTFKASALFGGMNKVKDTFEVIDDYSISDSSLEQVFLSFAKKSDDN